MLLRGVTSLHTLTRGMGRLVRVEVHEGVRVITIARKEKKNCVNHEVAKELISAFEDFDRNDEERVAILTGDGGTFCAGYDLSEVSKGEFTTPDVDFFQKYRYLGPTALRLSKPTIAAIEGYAVAGGLELTLFCDLRIAGDDAKMGVFCRRVGVPLIDGGTVRLPKIVGLGRALELVLTGREIGAVEAAQWGLVNKVVPKGRALEEAKKWANQLKALPQECMKVDRESTFYSVFDAKNEKDALDFEFSNGTQVLAHSILGARKFLRNNKDRKSKL